MDHPRAAAGAVLLAALTAVPLAGVPAAAATPSAAADGVQVRVGAAGDEARVHGTVDYAVTVANTGPEGLPDARIVQLLPEGLADVEAGQDGEAGDGEVVWERGLPAGGAVELESSGTVRSDAGGRLATTVCVRPAPGEGLVGCASESLPVGPVSKAWIAAWTAAAAGALLLLAVGGRWLLQVYRRFREDGVRIEYVTGRVAIPEPPLALARMPWRYRLHLLQAVPVAGTRTGESAQAPAPEAAGPAEAAPADPEQDRAEAPEAAEAVSETPAGDVRTGAAHDDEARKDAEPEPSGTASEDAAEEAGAEPDAGDGGDRDAAGAEADGQSAAEAAGAEPEEAAEDRETAEAWREEPAAGGENGASAAGATGADPDAEEERPAGEGAAAEQEAGEEVSGAGASDTGAAAEEQDPAGERQAEEAGGDRSAEAAAEGTGTGGAGATEEDAAVPAPRGRRKGRKPWSRKRKPRTGPERGVPEQTAGDGSADTAEETAVAERDLAPAERD
ncbi:DUF11 domain-containing protein [Nocardiopsis sp. CNT-189]|uniref:hypothetical protein n=1 Tax=Nocardiopsis oceanisediminis TaxID=2816862 RepID=UPI003B2EB5D9